MTGMLFLSKLVQVPYAYRFVPGLRNRLRLFDEKSFRIIAKFGVGIVLVSLSLAINSTGIRWIMNALTSKNFVAHLAIILMPTTLLSQIIRAVTITIMPATSAYEARGKHKMLQELLIRSMRYTMILVLAGILTAVLLMRNILTVWVGPEYEFLTPYAIVLFTSVSFMLSTNTAHHMLKGLGKLRAVALIYFIGLVIVPIGLILTVFNIWGNPYFAVTAGLAAGHVVCGFLQMRFCARAVGADLLRIFLRVYAQPLIVAMPVIFVTSGIRYIGVLNSLIGRIGVSFLAVLFFFIGIYAFVASEAERQQVRELFRLALNKINSIRGIPSKH
jgi:O-antigen/teichoic acid export membrane protein